MENNLEIQYSKEPSSNFEPLNSNHPDEMELEALSCKRIKNFMQLSLCVRKWAKFLGFMLHQERAEYFTKKNQRYNMVWRCTVSKCIFVVRFAREKDSFYTYDREKSSIHHNHHSRFSE